MPLLEVKDLSYRFNSGTEDFLRNVSFSVDKGEMVAVSGPSGCGKSTLLRCVNGIYPHVNGGTLSGDILYDGRSITAMPAERRSTFIGTVFQDFDSQILHLSVEDELAFGPENLGLDVTEISARVQEAADAVGLDLPADPSILSGGNKQRLCVGSALAMRPGLLLLDEPLSNIDVDGAAKLIKFLLLLKESGHSILLVEHRLDLIWPYMDRVIWMEQGRIVEHMPVLKAIEPGPAMNKNTEPAPSAVRARGLTFGYQKKQPVFSLMDLDVRKGEMAIILGKNGCGKSTLLKILAGLLPVKEGIVEIDGESIKGKKPGFFRSRVGLVMQNPNHQLFMDSVYNEIFFNCGDKSRAQEILDAFGLSALKDRHPYSLSEGEKRRTALAAILAARPAVLLLDEPTLGQDRENLIKMVEALRLYNKKEGLTVITVTHEEAAARALGDKVIVFGKRSVMEGGEESVKHYFSHPADTIPV